MFCILIKHQGYTKFEDTCSCQKNVILSEYRKYCVVRYVCRNIV